MVENGNNTGEQEYSSCACSRVWLTTVLEENLSLPLSIHSRYPGIILMAAKANSAVLDVDETGKG